jgi:7-cyano-7-deazaguanine synthase
MRVLLFSGGMDSTILLHREVKSGREFVPLAFHFGQKHERMEMEAAKKIARWYGVPLESRSIRKAIMPGEPGSVVPARNAVFVSIAANYVCQKYGGGTVIIGACLDDAEDFPDCRLTFVMYMNILFEESGVDVVVEAPLQSELKRDAAKTVPREALEMTYSCYVGGPVPCKACQACVRREKALGAGEAL